MTVINPAAQLASIIRAQFEHVRHLRGARAVKRAAKPKISISGQRERDVDVGEIIAQRLMVLGEDVSDQERKAFRIFLEVILTREIGARIVPDAGFQRLIDQVQSEMEGDPDLKEAIAQATRFLLSAPEQHVR